MISVPILGESMVIRIDLAPAGASAMAFRPSGRRVIASANVGSMFGSAAAGMGFVASCAMT
jgi:hypothetical protein